MVASGPSGTSCRGAVRPRPCDGRPGDRRADRQLLALVRPADGDGRVPRRRAEVPRAGGAGDPARLVGQPVRHGGDDRAQPGLGHRRRVRALRDDRGARGAVRGRADAAPGPGGAAVADCGGGGDGGPLRDRGRGRLGAGPARADGGPARRGAVVRPDLAGGAGRVRRPRLPRPHGAGADPRAPVGVDGRQRRDQLRDRVRRARLGRGGARGAAADPGRGGAAGAAAGGVGGGPLGPDQVRDPVRAGRLLPAEVHPHQPDRPAADGGRAAVVHAPGVPPRPGRAAGRLRAGGRAHRGQTADRHPGAGERDERDRDGRRLRHAGRAARLRRAAAVRRRHRRAGAAVGRRLDPAADVRGQPELRGRPVLLRLPRLLRRRGRPDPGGGDGPGSGRVLPDHRRRSDVLLPGRGHGGPARRLHRDQLRRGHRPRGRERVGQDHPGQDPGRPVPAVGRMRPLGRGSRSPTWTASRCARRSR